MTPVTGRYFDGQSSQSLSVDVTLERGSETLTLKSPALPGRVVHWRLETLRSPQEQSDPNQLVLAQLTDEAEDSGLVAMARLSLSDPELIADIRAACPNLRKRDVPRGTGMRVVKYLSFAIGAMLLMIFVILPRLSDTLAGLIPIEREVAFGKSVTAQMERFLGGTSIGSLTCSSAEGQAAVERMTARLTQNTPIEYDLNIIVMNHRMVNAFAAPGGQVVLMRGLIDKVDGPDALAAVLAHEIAHVESRDSTRAALRATGSAGLLSLVLGDFAGGTLALVLAEQLLQSGYTRQAEAEADVYALDMLRAADIKADGMARFFLSLKDIDLGMPDLPEYLSSHPILEDRAARANVVAETQRATRPALSEADWAALRKICG